MAQEIEHTHLPIRGLNIHVAQVGKDELGTVLFLHGFPEIWYSWRHQMLAVAAAGYRAIAPDCRGYGLSDQPPEDEEASWDDLVADVLAILDAYSIPKAFLVGKDFGALPAYEFALQHPDRTCGVACLGIPFNPAPMSFDAMPEGFYVLRWRTFAPDLKITYIPEGSHFVQEQLSSSASSRTTPSSPPPEMPPRP
ncbi:bifunctional epoxide hydrolase 2-like [Panicum miliaceum]|uniref:Bifunctional epoxide hydrolase 2-like n=1 Tax=Panicum miliaceum TaxID=4540 RepID=A0A3L6TMV8_PANMI|nr:bifunctional epoxide hydrolase 2-like [Panicum miliaceum]